MSVKGFLTCGGSNTTFYLTRTGDVDSTHMENLIVANRDDKGSESMTVDELKKYP